jgi:hypothetical protein
LKSIILLPSVSQRDVNENIKLGVLFQILNIFELIPFFNAGGFMLSATEVLELPLNYCSLRSDISRSEASNQLMHFYCFMFQAALIKLKYTTERKYFYALNKLHYH